MNKGLSIPAILFISFCAIVVLVIIGGITGSCEREEPEYIPDTQVWAHYDTRNPGPVPAKGEIYQLWDVYYVGSLKNNTEEPMDYHIEVVRRKARYNRYRLTEEYVPSTKETVGTVDLTQVKPGEEVPWEIMIYLQTEWREIHPDREYSHNHFQLLVNGRKYGDDLCLAW